MINLPFKVFKILRVKYSKTKLKTAILTNVTYYLFEEEMGILGQKGFPSPSGSAPNPPLIH